MEGASRRFVAARQAQGLEDIGGKALARICRGAWSADGQDEAPGWASGGCGPRRLSSADWKCAVATRLPVPWPRPGRRAVQIRRAGGRGGRHSGRGAGGGEARGVAEGKHQAGRRARTRAGGGEEPRAVEHALLSPSSPLRLSAQRRPPRRLSRSRRSRGGAFPLRPAAPARGRGPQHWGNGPSSLHKSGWK